MPIKLPALPRRNAPWTPLQRRTWLAEQRRKHRLAPPPVLRAKYPDLLAWNWELPNPFKWNVWQSLNLGVSWFLIEDFWGYGDARQFAPDGGGELYFIVGVDADGNEITQRSNVVRPDDAVAPVPLSMFGLQLWVRIESLAGLADGSLISNWSDESGHENPLLQANAGFQPLYRVNSAGQPSVFFDGVDDVLVSQASVFNPNQHTIFLVARPLVTSVGDAVGTGGTDNGDVLLMVYQNVIRGHMWRGSNPNVTDGGTTIHNGAFALFEQEVNATNLLLRLNGNLDGSNLLAGTPAGIRKSITLGSRSSGCYFNGHVCALLVYDRVLSPVDAERVRQFLYAAYAVPIPYPPAQPNAPVITDGSYTWEGSDPMVANVNLTFTFDVGSYPDASVEVWCARNGGDFVNLMAVDSFSGQVSYDHASDNECYFDFKLRYVNGTTVGPFSDVFHLDISM